MDRLFLGLCVCVFDMCFFAKCLVAEASRLHAMPVVRSCPSCDERSMFECDAGGSSLFGSGGHVPRNAACATVLTTILGHRRTACLEWACAMGMQVCLDLLDFRCFGVALGKEQAGRGKRLG